VEVHELRMVGVDVLVSDGRFSEDERAYSIQCNMTVDVGTCTSLRYLPRTRDEASEGERMTVALIRDCARRGFAFHRVHLVHLQPRCFVLLIPLHTRPTLCRGFCRGSKSAQRVVYVLDAELYLATRPLEAIITVGK
jgi:hypothetical protein